MTFNTTALAGERVLVTGTDSNGASGKAVLSSAVWEQAKRQRAFVGATEEFDNAVEEFFAPLMEAQEKLESIGQRPDLDKDHYFVINEGEVPTSGEDRIVIKLDHDGVVLRMLEEGKADRLVWVSDTQLEVTAEPFPTGTNGSTPAAPQDQGTMISGGTEGEPPTEG